ncbi:acid phosphatase aph 3-phytase phyB [Penicillium canescens]|nr:acid phosphatase aph 3-phytase phyB [Penicillium canescens]
MPPSLALAVICASGLSTSVSAFSYVDPVSRSSLEKQFSQEFQDGYSILRHYDGNGPTGSDALSASSATHPRAVQSTE